MSLPFVGPRAKAPGRLSRWSVMRLPRSRDGASRNALCGCSRFAGAATISDVGATATPRHRRIGCVGVNSRRHRLALLVLVATFAGCGSEAGSANPTSLTRTFRRRLASRARRREHESRAAVLARSPRGRPLRSRGYRFASVLHRCGPARNARTCPRTRRLDHPPQRSVGGMPGRRGQPVRAGRRVRNHGIAQDDRGSRKREPRTSPIKALHLRSAQQRPPSRPGTLQHRCRWSAPSIRGPPA